MSAGFFICDHCGNLITMLRDAGVPMLCCGEKMWELIPNTVEASGEKHLPVAERSGSTLTVTVGAVEHPNVPLDEFEEFKRHSALGRNPNGQKTDPVQAPDRGLGIPNAGIVKNDAAFHGPRGIRTLDLSDANRTLSQQSRFCVHLMHCEKRKINVYSSI